MCFIFYAFSFYKLFIYSIYYILFKAISVFKKKPHKSLDSKKEEDICFMPKLIHVEMFIFCFTGETTIPLFFGQFRLVMMFMEHVYPNTKQLTTWMHFNNKYL